MVFSRCIRFSSGLDFGGRCQSWAKKVEELPRPRSTTGKSSTLYRYGLDAGTDFFRAGIFITPAFALAGVSIPLLGGKGWEAADRWAVLGAAFAILSNAWRQLRPAILELGDVANLEARIPFCSAITQDGHWLLADSESGKFFVVDLASGAVAKTFDTPDVPVLPTPGEFALAPDGISAYVTCPQGGTIEILNLKDWKLEEPIRLTKGVDGMAWVPSVTN